MSTLPPPVPFAQPVAYAAPLPVSADDQHLRLLAIFHYVLGGLIVLGSSIALIHVGLGLMMITSPQTFANNPNSPPPPGSMGWLFLFLGLAILAIGWTLGGLVIYSGRCLSRRRSRTFSLVIAGLLCLNMPLGTILGVFTFIVLSRPTVKAEYDYRRANPA